MAPRLISSEGSESALSRSHGPDDHRIRDVYAGLMDLFQRTE